MLVDITTLPQEEIRKELDISKIGASILSSKELKYIFSAFGVWFDYDHAKSIGIDSPPHPVLPSGIHTNCYIVHGALLHKSQITEVFAQQLANRLILGQKLNKMKPLERLKYRDVWVIGPSYGAAFLVAAMAQYWNSWQGFTCKVVGIPMDYEWQSLPIPPGSLVQLVDDIIYSASADSLMATRNAIKEMASGRRIRLNKEIGVIINMSGKKKINNFRIKSLISLPPSNIWQSSNCPLCTQGSKPLSIQNEWPQLANACWREPPEPPEE